MAVILILAACGVGAVLGWAVRMTLSHLTAVGIIAVKALPVVLLIALMFFNPYAWIMAATISRPRLWLALLFLVTVAAAFVISGTLERVRPCCARPPRCPKTARGWPTPPLRRCRIRRSAPR